MTNLFKPRFLLLFLLFALGGFCIYIAILIYGDVHFSYDKHEVEKSEVLSLSFSGDPERSEAVKCVVKLASGKQIILFEGVDDYTAKSLKYFNPEGKTAICRYKKTLRNGNKIYSPYELQIGSLKVIDFEKRKASDKKFAWLLFSFGVLSFLIALYLFLAVMYVLKGKGMSRQTETARWKVGKWMLK